MTDLISLEYLKLYTKDWNKKDFIEVRTMVNSIEGSTNNFYNNFRSILLKNYRCSKKIVKELNGKEKEYIYIKLFDKIIAVTKNNCQIFIRVEFLDNFKLLFSYLEEAKNVKVCYSVNSKVIASDLSIAGGYDYMKTVNYLQFDIEETFKTPYYDGKEAKFDMFVDIITKKLSSYGLTDYTKVYSGNGAHAIFRIKETKITDGRKDWYKEFFGFISDCFNGQEFKLDLVKDFTRVLGLPGTLNCKWNKKVKLVNFSGVTNTFKLKTKKKRKYNVDKSNIKILSFKSDDEREAKFLEEPLVKALLNECWPKGERNLKLIFPLKLLFILYGYDERDEFVNYIYSEVDLVQGGKICRNFPVKAEGFPKNFVNSFFIELGLPIIYK